MRGESNVNRLRVKPKPSNNQSVGKRQVEQPDEKAPKKEPRDDRHRNRQTPGLPPLKFEVGEHHQGYCDGKAEEPNGEKETDKPAKHDEGSFPSGDWIDVLGELKIHRSRIGGGLRFVALQVQNDLNDGKNQHR